MGSDPKRRIANASWLGPLGRQALALSLAYVGSALHKTKPGDHGFQPPVNPRPWKSICDGHRTVLLGEAQELFRQGIALGLFSDFPEGGIPKYIWSVDDAGEIYEAKMSPGTSTYKGYRLEEEDRMRDIVFNEWLTRCQTT